jgi:hypothetical protein
VRGYGEGSLSIAPGTEYTTPFPLPVALAELS